MSAEWRKTRDYRVWRAKVIRRDKRCAVCNSIKNRHAHHKNNGDDFPEQRFIVDNGVTLCKDCHIQYHCQFHRGFYEKTTKERFDNFIELCEYLHENILNRIINLMRDKNNVNKLWKNW